jgi:hypothetical protein
MFFVKISQILAKLVKYAELCWIFGSQGHFFLSEKRRTPSTGETAGISRSPIETFIQFNVI